MNDPRLRSVALLLFGSGTCALIYQVAWLRELRLVFGSSTAASAAVLATFMGGLGLGSALLGKRADPHPSPLRLYAHLELGVAASAAVTPLLLGLGRQLYVLAGGSAVLGDPLATLARLLLTSLVIGLPTFLMGGTLPAASRAVESSGDAARRKLALLYGANTLGAVTGVTLANFLLVEQLGIRRTLLLAALLNALVGLVARTLSRVLGPASPPDSAFSTLRQRAARSEDGLQAAADRGGQQAAAPFVLLAAAVVGFIFLLMELVWYRMLTPLLGGTTFTFGLILAVALLGIGVGGAAYSLVERRPTLVTFATTCAVEGLAIAVPFALGDRLAYLAQLLRPLGTFGFLGYVAGWALVAAIVVLPAALVAGFQFPLLVALLGEGEERVGRHVGAAYAWNTTGAIAGSVAGGFGLLVLLGSSGAWRLAVVLSALLGLAAVLLGSRGRLTWRSAPATAIALLALLLLTARGPTAVWRQSPIGVGRVTLPGPTPNALRQWAHAQRRRIAWETDGKESAVGLNAAAGYAFVINGKVDGNAKADAPRQVMMGLIGAALHPQARQAMLIGLGTGSTAGWLARVDSIERLDVVELEPAIREIARVCAPVNLEVLENPKVHLTYADAREVLLTSRRAYDLILSEPSNPYTAGIASLFTREYYRAIAERLDEDGLFLQWLQAYEVDAETVETVMRTLSEVFPHVDIWQTMTTDLLFVASERPVPYDVPQLRQRLEQEPFRTALAVAWRTRGVEGLLSRFVADGGLVRAVAASTAAPVNTDDRNRVEFGFARTLGRDVLFSTEELRRLAHARGEDRPAAAGEVDWQRVGEERLGVPFLDQAPADAGEWLDPAQRVLATVFNHYNRGNPEAALAAFRSLEREPRDPNELLVVAAALAEQGDDAALPYLEALARHSGVEAEAMRARLLLRQGRPEESLDSLLAALAGFGNNPWVFDDVIDSALHTATELSTHGRDYAARLSVALGEPFAVHAKDDYRLAIRLRIAPRAGPEAVAAVLAPLEPEVPWDRYTLIQRAAAYDALGDPLADRAARDLAELLSHDSLPFAQRLRHGVGNP